MRKKRPEIFFSLFCFAELAEQGLCTMGARWGPELSIYLRTRCPEDAPAERGRMRLLRCLHHFGFLGFLKHWASLRSSLPWGLVSKTESWISAKHTEVLTKQLLWKQQMTQPFISFANPQAILGFCWLGTSWFRLSCHLQQTFLGKFRWSQDFFIKFKKTGPVQYVSSA